MLVENVEFALTDHNGKEVSELSYCGSWMLFFFGFTNCRSVCPRTLGRLSSALDRLGEGANDVRGLYVTVDPARDTPDVLREFLSERYPHFTGLTGSQQAIEAVKANFGVFARRVDESAGNYSMPHTSLTYLIDPRGLYRTHWSSVLEDEEIVDKLRIELSR
ncbi:SCO family protein [Rhizobium mesosinicum]|uniref:SCO family protein n=1 Tax=Rhizobium mesosinicum TaxID=335017 RepID=A0ABS7GN37_9HYPH|nr:SCO family protein [Rhizobium mesosinicum]MBW9051061.1 SCO family protein [Rhizobium mesosinicum]